MVDLIESSYQRQQAHGREMDLPACFSAPDSVDNWRHQRMFANLEPMLRAQQGARWLTIGDGAYGSDAHFLRSRGASVVASSLVTDRLKLAAERGWIDNYLQINAEQIALPDAAFDFVLCKAAYHHFPRPPMALYEMLRVARTAVVLLEPMESQRPLDALRHHVKTTLRGDKTTLFEPSGNYIYRISLRELERQMLAIGESAYAHRRFNDFFVPALARDTALTPSRGLRLTRLGIGIQNILSRTGLMGWGLCCAVLFKGRPQPVLRSALEQAAFSLVDLPANPYAELSENQ